MRDLLPLEFGSAMSAVDVCRRHLDWLPTAHQFTDAYQAAVGRRLDGERDQQRALMDASATPADSAIAKRCLGEIRKQLAGARGPLARDLRAEFDREEFDR